MAAAIPHLTWGQTFAHINDHGPSWAYPVMSAIMDLRIRAPDSIRSAPGPWGGERLQTFYAEWLFHPILSGVSLSASGVSLSAHDNMSPYAMRYDVKSTGHNFTTEDRSTVVASFAAMYAVGVFDEKVREPTAADGESECLLADTDYKAFLDAISAADNARAWDTMKVLSDWLRGLENDRWADGYAWVAFREKAPNFSFATSLWSFVGCSPDEGRADRLPWKVGDSATKGGVFHDAVRGYVDLTDRLDDLNYSQKGG